MIRRCTAVGASTGLLDQRQDAPNRENASRWASLIAFGKLVDISTCKLSDVTPVSLNCTKTRLKPSHSHCLNHPEHRKSTASRTQSRAIVLAGTDPRCREGGSHAMRLRGVSCGQLRHCRTARYSPFPFSGSPSPAVRARQRRREQQSLLDMSDRSGIPAVRSGVTGKSPGCGS